MANLRIGTPISIIPHWRVRGLGGALTERLDGSAYAQVYVQHPTSTGKLYVQLNDTLSITPYNRALSVVGGEWYASWTPQNSVAGLNVSIEAFHSDPLLESQMLLVDAQVTVNTLDSLAASPTANKRLVFGPTG